MRLFLCCEVDFQKEKETGGLDSRLWLRAEYMLVFSAGEKELRVSAIDLVRAHLLGTVVSSSNDLAALCQQAVATIRQPVGVAADPPPEHAVSATGPSVRLTGTFSVDEIACALRRVADHPKDMGCWSHLMVLIQGHPGYPVVFKALVPYFEAAIPRDTQDTPVWLAAAGWMSYVYDADQVDEALPMEGYFTKLLEQYPDHMQSQMVRYNSALVSGYRSDYALSLPGMAEAVSNVADRVVSMHDFIPISGCRGTWRRPAFPRSCVTIS